MSKYIITGKTLNGIKIHVAVEGDLITLQSNSNLCKQYYVDEINYGKAIIPFPKAVEKDCVIFSVLELDGDVLVIDYLKEFTS